MSAKDLINSCQSGNTSSRTNDSSIQHGKNNNKTTPVRRMGLSRLTKTPTSPLVCTPPKFETNISSSSITSSNSDFKKTPVRRMGLSRIIKTPNSPLTYPGVMSESKKSDDGLQTLSDKNHDATTTSKHKLETSKLTPVKRVGLSRRSLAGDKLFQCSKDTESPEKLHNIGKVAEENKVKTENSLRSEILETIPLVIHKADNNEMKSTNWQLNIETERRLIVVLEDIYKKEKCVAENMDENELRDNNNYSKENDEIIGKIQLDDLAIPQKGSKSRLKIKLSLKKTSSSIETDDVVDENNYIEDNTNSCMINELQTLVENKQKDIGNKLKLLQSLKRLQTYEMLVNVWEIGFNKILIDLHQTFHSQGFNIEIKKLQKRFM